MTLKKKTLGLFPLCLGLSLLWHFFGAVAIGIAPEPTSSYAQAVVPTLALVRPLEVLHVGMDGTGQWIERAVTSDHDPEYFGFPRHWAQGRFQNSPDATGHIPWTPAEFTFPKAIPASSGEYGNREKLGTVPMPEIPFRNLAQTADAAFPSILDDSPKEIPGIQLALHGHLARRKCLIQVLPHFEFRSPAENRNLLLGGKEAQEETQGLKIRLAVSGDGNVRFVLLESSSGDAQLDSMALKAVLQWQFAQEQEPANAWDWGTVRLERRRSL